MKAFHLIHYLERRKNVENILQGNEQGIWLFLYQTNLRVEGWSMARNHLLQPPPLAEGLHFMAV